jgi:hypothetical protein
MKQKTYLNVHRTAEITVLGVDSFGVGYLVISLLNVDRVSTVH